MWAIILSLANIERGKIEIMIVETVAHMVGSRL